MANTVANDIWPEHFNCFCGDGQQWWSNEQKRYACNASGCTIVMTEEPNIDVLGVWMGEHRITRC